MARNKEVNRLVKRRRIKNTITTIIMLAGVLLGYNIMNRGILGKAEVSGSSMEPTYYDYDESIFSRIAEPERCDVVIFDMDGTTIIKRLIAKGGDTVKIVRDEKTGLCKVILNGKELYERDVVIFDMDGTTIIKRLIAKGGDTVKIVRDEKTGLCKVILNGKELYEPYIVEGWTNSGYYENEEIKLKENEYFLMGDHREVSKDSRVVGPFTRDQYIGTVIFDTKKTSHPN